MQFFSFLVCLLPAVSAVTLQSRQTLTGSTICAQIAANITGQVYYPLSINYIADTEHYMSSSTQSSLCVVEVASAQDVSTVIKLVGQTRTPFAVKSGGHASNPGFSSTPGVHISLAKMKQITLSANKSTVEIGLGNVWTDVYAALNGSGKNVIGGRVNGPGTGGFSLGGGYSWKSNQYGLTCDTTVSYNLVLPNGTITTVDSSQKDLFFALKGGLNRFGIVTSIVYRTVPQVDLIYGGNQFFTQDKIPALIAATTTFQTTNKDPKAQVILTINSGEDPGAILISFYDGPTRPAAFAPFNNISAIYSDLATQTFSAFASSSPDELTSGNRGAFHTFSTTSLTRNFLAAVANETAFYGTLAIAHLGLLISYDVEPFTDYGKHATDSAWPHANSPLPINLYYSWQGAAEDAYWRGAIQQSVNTLIAVARKEGIYSEDMYAYPNYALSTYTGPQLYGPANARRLRAIQAQVDPEGVMLLAGGFTI